jgi:hypothetical protein
METRDWGAFRSQIADTLARRTGVTVDQWTARIRESAPTNRMALYDWLTGQGITGYPRMLLGYEHFGYPEFMVASADELIESQYANRPQLRPILDAILEACATIGEITLQARKSYVSLVGPKRTFAVVQATLKDRVDLGLRLANPSYGRIQSRAGLGSGQMTCRIPLANPEEVDQEVLTWLRRAYEENA